MLSRGKVIGEEARGVVEVVREAAREVVEGLGEVVAEVVVRVSRVVLWAMLLGRNKPAMFVGNIGMVCRRVERMQVFGV